ncbi:hypothetical protein [Oceanobacillus sp. J11TS1]|uniref:hypothetical protein n=1 Tax=Oceanobacillus sp. J11TS1 TaxID=2807191 RepID=UPI001B1A4E41|nr:hypothetical protein [Oceanobacillus sp. J11TS1]GIO25194.1 hypothetical protein J11TS1_37750 [Oceanobacillus sp. J11TS1]
MNNYGSNNPHHPDHQPSWHEQCQRYKDFHVEIQTTDGHSYDGILADYDQNQLALLVPEDVEEGDYRQYGGYRRRYRRYRPRYFPLGALAALALYPYFFPPYPYPYYPY